MGGKSLLHRQCHFGKDTLRFAVQGAQVTAINFSERAISYARAVAAQIQLPATFIHSDLYDLPNHLHEQDEETQELRVKHSYFHAPDPIVVALHVGTDAETRPTAPSSLRDRGQRGALLRTQCLDACVNKRGKMPLIALLERGKKPIIASDPLTTECTPTMTGLV